MLKVYSIETGLHKFHLYGYYCRSGQFKRFEIYSSCFFLQGIFIVRQSPMLHCEDVTMQGALLWKPYWRSLHDLEELFPFAWLCPLDGRLPLCFLSLTLNFMRISKSDCKSWGVYFISSCKMLRSCPIFTTLQTAGQPPGRLWHKGLPRVIKIIIIRLNSTSLFWLAESVQSMYRFFFFTKPLLHLCVPAND